MHLDGVMNESAMVLIVVGSFFEVLINMQYEIVRLEKLFVMI
jgi:hypothetical protein